MQIRRRISVETRAPARLFAGVAVSVIVLDQIVKAVVRALMTPGQSIALIDGVVDLTYVRNTGAAFGLLPGYQSLFRFTGAIVIVGVLLYALWTRPRARWLVVSLALISSGAAGNLIDRLAIGKVTDFFDVLGALFPVFNIADSAIVVGVGMLLVWILFGPEPAEQGSEEGAESEYVPGLLDDEDAT